MRSPAPEPRPDDAAPAPQNGALRPPARGPAAAPPARVIGSSHEERPLGVVHFGRSDAPLRVLVLSGQHGDEPRARAAVAAFAARQAETPRGTAHEAVALAVLADANPDGAARGTRANARGVDLNRDHALLESAEAQALHRFVQDWQPHLVIDVHTYPPRRTHLLEDDLIYCHDVFLDVPSTPGLRHAALTSGGRQRFFDAVTGGLEAEGYRSARYTLVNDSGRVRHSTPDVVDARNALALRYGCLTVLVEGRRPVRTDGEKGHARLNKALQATLRQLVAWAARHQGVLTLPPAPLRPSTRVTIDSRYARADAPCTMAFEDAATGEIRDVTLPGKYTPHLESTRRVRLPAAYAVPTAYERLLAVLARHGFSSYPGRPGGLRQAEHTWIQRVRPSPRARRAPRELTVGTSRTRQALSSYEIFPVTHHTGRALAVLLEAASKYGLHRFEETGLALKERFPYPVVRVH